MSDFILGIVIVLACVAFVLLCIDWHRIQRAGKERTKKRLYANDNPIPAPLGPPPVSQVRAVPYTPDKPPEPCVNCRCELLPTPTPPPAPPNQTITKGG